MMHLQLHSSHVIKKRSNFEWGDDDYIDLQHKKALVRVARRLVHDTSHVTNIANILLEAQTNLSLISSRSDISFLLLYTSTVTDEIALLYFDNLATYFLFSQITDFEFIAQSTDFHFLIFTDLEYGEFPCISFHVVSHVHCNCVLGLGSGTVVGALANLAGVRFPVSASYGGRLCFWLSPLLRELFLRVLRFSRLLKNQRFQIPIRSGYSG